MKVWVVADVKSPDGRVWELIGVFDSEVLADTACTMPNHAMFSTELNARLPEETTVAPDARYPRYACQHKSETLNC
jgi:hypothetical protein